MVDQVDAEPVRQAAGLAARLPGDELTVAGEDRRKGAVGGPAERAMIPPRRMYQAGGRLVMDIRGSSGTWNTWDRSGVLLERQVLGWSIGAEISFGL